MLYVFDDYELDTQACELRRAGKVIALAPKTYAVLAYLVQHRERLISKEELLEQVWADIYVDDSAVKRNIMAVRRALGDHSSASQHVKTQRGQGYRFIAWVAVRDDLPGDAIGKASTSEPAEVPEAPSAGDGVPSRSGRDALASHVMPDVRPCAQCQRANSASARFCSGCGAPLGATCGHCDAVVLLPATFCPACGQRLTAVSFSESVASAPLPPASLLTQPWPADHSAGSGERKLVTTLCCLVGNASRLLERLGPDAMHRLMQAVYELIHNEMQPYAGTIQYITGESFLVFFGVPQAQEDHARRAILAALGLQRRLRQSQSCLPLPPGEELTLRMALHTGLAIVGPIGSDQPTAVIGEVTTLATALARHATPGTLLASTATLRWVQGEVQSTEHAPLYIDEHSLPVPVHQVLHLVLPSPPRGGTMRRSPFVGRDAELALLRTRLARAEQGQGQVVSIMGEPGIGKSRLLDELRQETAAREVKYVQGSCQSYGRTIPYLPILDLLRRDWDISEADTPETLSSKILAALQASELSAWKPHFLHLLGLQAEPDRLAETSPEVRKAQTFAALHQLMRHYSQVRPCILVIENVHWIDATSEAYLRALVEPLVRMRLLLLLTFRPEYRASWLDKSYATHIALQSLETGDSQRIVHAILHPTPLPASLEGQLLSKAAGNPFFLEELARAAVEQGERQAALVVPDTIQAVLTARIDRLPAAAKRLLQTAAVIGADVPVSLLRAVVGLSEERLRCFLSQLQASEFLDEIPFVAEGVYAFKHALTHEVAYGSLLQEQRRTLHRRIVEALETLYANRLTEHVDRLAHHAWQGEMWDKAFHYFWQAGTEALERSANREAITSFEQALHCLAHLPENRQTQALAIDLRLDMRNVLLRLGENERCLDLLRQATPLAEELDDARRLGWLSSFLSTHYLLLGDADHAIDAGERALALAMTCNDTALQVDAHLHLGQAYHARGAYQQAAEVLKWNVGILRQSSLTARSRPAGLTSLHSLSWLTWCCAELGDFAEGMAYGAEAVQLVEAREHPYELVATYGSVGLLHLRKGDLHEAFPLLERALSLCQSANIPLLFPTIAASLGAAYALSGQLSEALALLERAAAQATAMHLMVYHAFTVTALSEAHLLAGNLEEASAHARHALELCRAHKEESQQAWTLRLLGEVAARRDPAQVEAAETAYRQALIQANRLGLRPLLAHCHFGLGTLYAHHAGRAQAQRELSMALTLYRSMEMTFWQRRAVAVLAQVMP